jgi:NADH-quinone oxidoreductase subunit J
MNALGTVYFYVCAALALLGASSVVLSKNPIRSAMGLLLLILSVAGLFLALHAQFLAAIQLIVYAGAIVVLFLFVIMLLGPAASTPNDRRGLAVRIFSGGLFGLAGLASIALTARALQPTRTILPLPDTSFGGIEAIGAVLFSDALVPFEVSSALLMVAVVGAVAVAKGRQGLHTLSANELEVGRRQATPSGVTGEGPASGVFSHELPPPVDGALDGPANNAEPKGQTA